MVPNKTEADDELTTNENTLPEPAVGVRYEGGFEEDNRNFEHIHNTLFWYTPPFGENKYILMEWHTEDAEYEVVQVGEEIAVTNGDD